MRLGSRAPLSLLDLPRPRLVPGSAGPPLLAQPGASESTMAVSHSGPPRDTGHRLGSPRRYPAQLAWRVVEDNPDRPTAVFLFYTDGSGVDAYQSLDAVRGEIEAVDVDDGAYALFTDDGRVIEARSGGRWGQDVLLHVTENRQRDELEHRLRSALPLVGLDPHLAALPSDAAQALSATRSRARWLRRD
jgi:hypothetical protein